jgi:transcription initiation factor TFIIB
MTMFALLEYNRKCDSCQSDDLISDHCTGDLVCRSCGTVLGDRLVSDEAEWRDYDDKAGDSSAARSSMLVIDGDEMEHRLFSGGNKEDRDLLNRIQNSGYSKKEMKMFDSYNNLGQLTFKLGLSDTLTVSWSEAVVGGQVG